MTADAERWVTEPAKDSGYGRTQFERDRARVLHSAGFRRLATKTQVHTAGSDDFLRTRLTHSLEVAQISREMGARLGCDPDVVDTAGLAHDLGHPPFGHNGEAALDRVAQACGGFEGNAQTLRVLTRLEAKVDGAGLNLTRASLDAACKYPWPRRDGQRKFGVYADDMPVFEWLREGAPDRRRCLEAQVMDWADDVAYSVHDLEDGIHSGHVPPDALADPGAQDAIVSLATERYAAAHADDAAAAADRLASLPFWVREFDGSHRGLIALKRMTSELIARLSVAAVDATRAAYGDRRLARYDADLIVPADIRAECAVLKAVADRYVMSREETVRRQATQREQLLALVDALSSRAPGSLEPWLHEAWLDAADDAGRLRIVVDQVASLTDTSAAAWFERWVS